MKTEMGGQCEAYCCAKRMKTRKQETKSKQKANKKQIKKRTRNKQEIKMKENEDTEWIQ